MKLGKPQTEVPYWDEGNKTKYKWFQKGKWKKILRKRWFRKALRNTEE